MAVLFHGAYDFFLFVNFVPGLSFGAFASLIISFLYNKFKSKITNDLEE